MLVAAAYLAAHVPYLAPALEDIDSINFALGLRDFDVAAHRPHPPGYPVFIALGRVALAVTHALAPTLTPSVAEARALAALSAVAGAAAIVGFGVCVANLDRDRWVRHRVWAVALLAVSPLFWMAGLRPMSDMVGLALVAWALAAVSAGSARGLWMGAALAGLGAGVRVQAALLTVPALCLALWWQRRERAGPPVRVVGQVVLALALSGLAWFVPLVWLSGGVGGYLQALGSQAGEDFAWVDMLWANPTPRRLAAVLADTLVRPWSSPALATAVVLLAVVGAGMALLWQRRALIALCVTFGPYALFHILLQETSHVRYALPLVIPVCWLASLPLGAVGRFGAVGSLPGLAVAAACLTVAVPVAVAYGRQPHPAFRLIADMARDASRNPPGAVLSHYALYRPLEAAAPSTLPVVPPVRNHEWLAAVRYWQQGGSNAVWFLADPRRTDLELIDARAVESSTTYPWDVAQSPVLGGTRPVGAVWHRLTPPSWMVGPGWSLTPEAGGRVRAERSGPDRQPIEAWVRRTTGPALLLMGGYYLGDASGPSTALTLEVDGTPVDRWTHDHASAGPAFLRMVRLPNGVPAGEGAYATVRVQARASTSGPAGELAIRQFDVQSEAGRMLGFGAGWYEDELAPDTGERWRWSSDRADLFVLARDGATLVLRGESPLKYFDDAPTVRLSVGERTLATLRPSADFEWRVQIPAGALPAEGGTVTLSLDRAYLPGPAEGTSDTRRLGLRIFRARLEPPT